MFFRLNPTIPVTVGDKGSGEALAWLDYSSEHDLMWVVALDISGEVWVVPNPAIRLCKNYTVGRTLVPSGIPISEIDK